MLDAELPDTLMAALPSFIISVVEQAVRRESETSRFCDGLFSLLLLYKEQVLPSRPEDSVLLEAHRPVEPVLAKVFDEASRALRGIPRG